MSSPVPVILSGFGQWVKNRTVMPLLAQRPDAIKVAVVTSIGQEEFKNAVRPAFAEKGWPAPDWIPDFGDACTQMRARLTEPAGVLITTPNAFHFSEAKKAIEMGYHVYVERPVVINDDPLPSLITLAKTNGVLFLTGTQRRLEDTFQYLLRAVVGKHEFGELRRIRCRFAAGHRLKDWRRKPECAGGGVVIDSGYHLIDVAAWLLSSTGISISGSLDGAVRFGFDESCGLAKAPVETEAVGYVRLPPDILLSFDFTYNAPEGSIYEQVELCDRDGARIVLTRDQAVRTPLPATIAHQLADGRLARLETTIDQGIRVEGIRFAGEAQNARPLHLFAEAIQQGIRNTPQAQMLEACHSISTWNLIREIYRLAFQDSRQDKGAYMESKQNTHVHMHHVALQTAHFQRAFDLYTKVLGLGVVKEPFTFKGKRTLAWLNAGTITIELYSVKDGKTPQPYDDRRVGADHIAFEVQNLDIVLEQLRDHGIKVLKGPFLPPTGDPQQPRVAFIEGVDGEEVELREPPCECDTSGREV